MTEVLSRGREAGRVLVILALSGLGLYLYSLGLEVGDQTRVWVFDGMCPAEAKQVWPLEWCEMVWWHPFRLATRVLPAFVVGIVLFVLVSHTRRFTRLAVSQWGSALLIWLACHVLWIAHLSPAMLTGMIQRDCLKGRYSADLDWAQCQTQLGRFGDQRLYYPLTVGITLAYLIRNSRRRERGGASSRASEPLP